MKIYLGADHAGFELKEQIKLYLQEKGHEVEDCGAFIFDQTDDYPDFTGLVAQEVIKDPDNRRGILICGSGVGIDIAANKFPRIRSALANNSDQAFLSRNDTDANVLCLASDFLDEEMAKKILSVWLQTPFSQEERHKRRIRKIGEIEANNSN